MRENYFINSNVEMWIEDEILYVVFFKGAKIDEHSAKEIIIERLKIANGNTYPCFVDISNGPNFTKEAREEFAGNDALKCVSAGCINVQNPVQKLICMAFIMIQKPALPTKFTLSKSEALDWLSQYKSHKVMNQAI